jgi:hypothetical protein
VPRAASKWNAHVWPWSSCHYGKQSLRREEYFW